MVKVHVSIINVNAFLSALRWELNNFLQDYTQAVLFFKYTSYYDNSARKFFFLQKPFGAVQRPQHSWTPSNMECVQHARGEWMTASLPSWNEEQ